MARKFGNRAVETTLSTALALDGVETTIDVGSTTNWPAPGAGDTAVGALDYGDQAIVEIFSYTGLTATSFTGVTRGLDGTTKPAHAIGARVRHVGSAADIERGATAITTIQDEGVAVAQQPIVNVTGAGATVTNDAANGRTNVTIPGSTAYLLASKTYAPATTADLTTTSTTPADVDATNLAVTFTAPASGVVDVVLEALVRVDTDGVALYWGLREGTTTLRQKQVTTRGGTTNSRFTATFRVGGLTAGTSYTYKWSHHLGGASTGHLFARSDAEIDSAGQPWMKVFEAPA